MFGSDNHNGSFPVQRNPLAIHANVELLSAGLLETNLSEICTKVGQNENAFENAVCKISTILADQYFAQASVC